MSNNNASTALILAAGEGTRMKSDIAKVLHRVGGQAMIRHVIDSVREAGISRVLVVVGYQADTVKAELRDQDLEFVLQEERLGTAHAVLMAEAALESFEGTVIVLTGDTPLLKSDTISELIGFHRRENSDATVLTAVLEDASGYGRIIRDENNNFVKIVEHGDAGREERKVKEINSGIFCFDCRKLFHALDEVEKDNVQKEYYLTDVIDIFRSRGWPVQAYPVGDSDQVMGVNSIEQLKQAERVMKDNG